jgi:hypothetical protein
MHTCLFCSKTLLTPKGLSLHLRNTAACRKARAAWRARRPCKLVPARSVSRPEEDESIGEDESTGAREGKDRGGMALAEVEDARPAGDGRVHVPPPREPTPDFDVPMADAEEVASPVSAGADVGRARAEDVEDKGDASARFPQPFPEEWRAGAPVNSHRQPTLFELMRDEALERGEVWGPFDSEDEVELAQWLFDNVGMGEIDNFLRLRFVRLFLLTLIWLLYLILSRVSRSEITLSFRPITTRALYFKKSTCYRLALTGSVTSSMCKATLSARTGSFAPSPSSSGCATQSSVFESF